jgi:hypothetical protein
VDNLLEEGLHLKKEEAEYHKKQLQAYNSWREER